MRSGPLIVRVRKAYVKTRKLDSVELKGERAEQLGRVCNFEPKRTKKVKKKKFGYLTGRLFFQHSCCIFILEIIQSQHKKFQKYNKIIFPCANSKNWKGHMWTEILNSPLSLFFLAKNAIEFSELAKSIDFSNSQNYPLEVYLFSFDLHGWCEFT